MATSVVSNFTEALKYTYGTKNVLYLINKEMVTWRLLNKIKKPMGGRGQFILPILVDQPGTWSGMVEGGTLPTAVNPDTAEASYSLKEFGGTYTMSWKLIQDSRSSKFAFETALKLFESAFERRVLRMLNADFIDDGRGRLAVLPAADDQTTVTIDGPTLLETGLVVDVMDTDNDTKHADSVTVTAVDVVNNTVTLSGAPSGTAANDYIVLEDTTDDSVNDALHTNGLLGLIDDENPATIVGNVGAINRSTAGNEYWESYVDANATNRTLTEDMLLVLEDNVRLKSGAKVNAYLTNNAIMRRYHELLREDTYFAMSKPSALGKGVGLGREGQSPGQGAADGKSGYRFSGVPWHVEPYFRANTVIAMDTSHFFVGHGTNAVPRPVSEIFDGVPMFKTTANSSFDVNWYWQGQLMTDNPAAGAKIEAVAQS